MWASDLFHARRSFIVGTVAQCPSVLLGVFVFFQGYPVAGHRGAASFDRRKPLSRLSATSSAKVS
jgi:hypothetical protein